MPPVSLTKFAERLVRGEPVPAIVLVGTDSYLRQMCRRQIIEASVPEGAREWAVSHFSARGADWDDILGRAETLPMLAPRQVFIIEDAEAVEKLGDDARDELLKALQDYLGAPGRATVLVFEAAALDRRLKFYKFLAEEALVVELTIGRESVPALAQEMAKKLGAVLERDAATLLADIVANEPARIHVELEKLASYARGRSITCADVEALVVAARKNTVWQLADMLAGRRRADAFLFLENLLREGEDPAGIVGALAWMYRKLIEARELPAHASGFQAARQLGMNPESAAMVVRQAHRIPRKELLAGLVALADADSQLKSANPNRRATLEFLLARLTASSSTPVARPA